MIEFYVNNKKISMPSVDEIANYSSEQIENLKARLAVATIGLSLSETNTCHDRRCYGYWASMYASLNRRYYPSVLVEGCLSIQDFETNKGNRAVLAYFPTVVDAIWRRKDALYAQQQEDKT